MPNKVHLVGVCCMNENLREEIRLTQPRSATIFCIFFPKSFSQRNFLESGEVRGSSWIIPNRGLKEYYRVNYSYLKSCALLN